MLPACPQLALVGEGVPIGVLKREVSQSPQFALVCMAHPATPSCSFQDERQSGLSCGQ